MTDEYQHDQEGKPLPHVIDDVSKYMNELISDGFEGKITKKEMNDGVQRILDKVLMQMKKDFIDEDEQGILAIHELIKHLTIGHLHTYLNRGDTDGK